MPIECPKEMPGSCQGCSDLWEGHCGWFFPKRPLSEILTTSERLDALEAKRQSEPHWTPRQWDYVMQLRAQMNHLENKVNALQQKKKWYARY